VWHRSLWTIYTAYRIQRRAPYKTYLAIFVCFSTKAVHAKLIADLWRNTFILALKRFVSRRGIPKRVYCDNATNFIGAINHLNEFRLNLFKQKSQDSLFQFASQYQLEFKFISPQSVVHYCRFLTWSLIRTLILITSLDLRNFLISDNAFRISGVGIIYIPYKSDQNSSILQIIWYLDNWSFCTKTIYRRGSGGWVESIIWFRARIDEYAVWMSRLPRGYYDALYISLLRFQILSHPRPDIIVPDHHCSRSSSRFKLPVIESSSSEPFKAGSMLRHPDLIHKNHLWSAGLCHVP